MLVSGSMYHIPLAFQCVYGSSYERCENGDVGKEVKFLEEGLLHAVTWFCVTSWRKLNADKSKGIVLGGEGILECEIRVDQSQME